MRAPTILLVSPAFHGYWKAIEASLNVAGYEVRTHIYDAPGTVADRIRNKLAHELPEKYRPASAASQATARAIAAFDEYRPDIVLVIKGDLLGDNWWQKLEESGVRYGTWLYDELRRMSYTLEDLPRLGVLHPGRVLRGQCGQCLPGRRLRQQRLRQLTGLLGAAPRLAGTG